jgi:hypothetical protein
MKQAGIAPGLFHLQRLFLLQQASLLPEYARA